MSDIKKAAEAAERACQKEIAEGIKRCSFPEQKLDGNDLLGWLYNTHRPDLHTKDVLPPIMISEPGGGSSNSRRKKSAKGNKVYADVWEGV